MGCSPNDSWQVLSCAQVDPGGGGGGRVPEGPPCSEAPPSDQLPLGYRVKESTVECEAS